MEPLFYEFLEKVKLSFSKVKGHITALEGQISKNSEELASLKIAVFSIAQQLMGIPSRRYWTTIQSAPTVLALSEADHVSNPAQPTSRVPTTTTSNTNSKLVLRICTPLPRASQNFRIAYCIIAT